MKNLKDLFEHQLKDLYSAETQLVSALPNMVTHAKSAKLKKAFEEHLKETQHHQERLKDICEDMGIKPTGEVCNAMKGLITEAEKFLEEEVENFKKSGRCPRALKIVLSVVGNVGYPQCRVPQCNSRTNHIISI